MLNLNTPWLEKGDVLVCFGDSITANQDGYVKILGQKLNRRGIKVINAGLGGDKTPAALTRLKTEVLIHKPDAVLIALGTNDAAVGRGKWADEPMVPPEAYKSNLKWITHICKLSGVKKISISTPADNFEGRALCDFGTILEKYCAMAREAADETGSRLVPVDMAFRHEKMNKKTSAGLVLTTDGIHMTAQGNRLIAATMLAAWAL